MNKSYKHTLEEWDRRATRAVLCHFESAKVLKRYHLWLGIPSLIIIALLGSIASFGEINQSSNSEPQLWLQWLLICLTIASAILVGLQTFLNFSQRAQKHRDDAAEYSSIRREIEHLAILNPDNGHDLETRINDLRSKLDILSKTTQEIPNKIWEKHKKKYKKGDYISTIFDKKG